MGRRGCGCCTTSSSSSTSGGPPCGGDRLGYEVEITGFSDCTDTSGGFGTNPCSCSRPLSNINGTYDFFPPEDFDGTLTVVSEVFQWWSSPASCCPKDSGIAFHDCAGYISGHTQADTSNPGIDEPFNWNHFKVSVRFECAGGELSADQITVRLCESDGTEWNRTGKWAILAGDRFPGCCIYSPAIGQDNWNLDVIDPTISGSYITT